MIENWVDSTGYAVRSTVTGSNRFNEKLTGSATGSVFACHLRFSQKQVLDIEGNVVFTKAQILVPTGSDILYRDKVYIDDYSPYQVCGFDLNSSNLAWVVLLK